MYGNLLPRVCPDNLCVLNGKGWWRVTPGRRSCNMRQFHQGAGPRHSCWNQHIGTSKPGSSWEHHTLAKQLLYLVSDSVRWAHILTIQLSSRHMCRQDSRSRLLSCMTSRCQHSHNKLQHNSNQHGLVPGACHDRVCIRSHCKSPMTTLQEQQKFRSRTSLTIGL